MEENSDSMDAFLEQIMPHNSSTHNIGESIQQIVTEEQFQQIYQTVNLDLETLLEPFSNNSNQSLLSDETGIGFSPRYTTNQNDQDMFNAIPQAAAFPETPSGSLMIVAQPDYGSKLRYRSDYTSNNSRKGFIGCTNRQTYTGPTIRIPLRYLNPNQQLYIRIGLVTVNDGINGPCYVHPYELENPSLELTDRAKNAVWFPIKPEDVQADGIKSFPTLRIVKQTAPELRAHGSLRVFDSQNGCETAETEPQPLNAKHTIKRFNLDKSRLTFSVGRKVNPDDEYPTEIFPGTTVFSNEMVEGASRGDTNEETNQQEPTPAVSSPIPRMYKYAPRKGLVIGGDEVLVFYTKKLDERRYGDLKVVFQANDSGLIFWSEHARDVEVLDRMVSFKSPPYPVPISEIYPVKILLVQDERELDTLQYFYLPANIQCPTCRQATIVEHPTTEVVTNQNKRPVSDLFSDNYSDDGVVPVAQSTPEYRQSNSEPTGALSNSANIVSTHSLTAVKPTNPSANAEGKLLEKINEAAVSLFANNNLGPLLRICRLGIRHHPDNLLQTAIINGYSDVAKQFIPTATIDILQRRNDSGETALLLAARLNRTSVVKELLECKHGDTLLADVDHQNHNILHLVALNPDSDETLELLIEHLLRQSVNITDKFDKPDSDKHTPLQQAICCNNLSATRRLLPHLKKDVCQTSDGTGDNLVHLAVRHGNLALLKYLIDEAKLTQQGNQSNTTMTPLELAQSLRHDDIIEYLNQKYPPAEIEESSTDDDE